MEGIECDADTQVSKEKHSINNALDALIAPLQVEDEEALLSDHPPELSGRPDFSQLVVLRQLHQTKRAAQSTRTSTFEVSERESLRKSLIKQVRSVLKLSDEDQGTTTGVGRSLRWGMAAPGGRNINISEAMIGGNALNARRVANVAASEVCGFFLMILMRNTYANHFCTGCKESHPVLHKI